MSSKTSASRVFVVVLGAPNDDDGNLSEIARSRLELGTTILNDMPEATMVLTGGFGPHFNTSPVEHAVHARRHLLKVGLDPQRIHLESVASSNTKEDASLVRKLLDEHLPCRIIVVTSAFHATRAQILFDRSFAPQEVEVCGAPDPSGTDLTEILEHEAQALSNLDEEL